MEKAYLINTMFFEWGSKLQNFQWPKEIYQEIQSLKRERRPTIQPKKKTP
jgi:hypothetical protein